MKWAYLHDLALCLPVAAALGRHTEAFPIFDKAKPIERWRRKARDLINLK
jgi:hypothetical protein